MGLEANGSGGGRELPRGRSRTRHTRPGCPDGRSGSTRLEHVFAAAPAGAWRVLGVDPGLTRCGVGIVDATGSRVRLVGVETLRTDPQLPVALRLLALEHEIERLLEEHRPEAVAVERVFSQHNVRTVMGTAQAGAVALLAAARRGLPVAVHTPSEVKAAVTGSGRAGKEQVGLMVARLLGLSAAPTPADSADALALAICHAWRAPAQQRRAAALARSGSTGAGRARL